MKLGSEHIREGVIPPVSIRNVETVGFVPRMELGFREEGLMSGTSNSCPQRSPQCKVNEKGRRVGAVAN